MTKAKAARAKGSKPNGRLTADDLFVRRDKDNELVPIEAPVAGMRGKTIMVLPATIGSMKGIEDPDIELVHWKIKDRVQYVTDHVVEPDLRGLSFDEVTENITLHDLDLLLISAVQAGGPQRQVRQEKKE